MTAPAMRQPTGLLDAVRALRRALERVQIARVSLQALSVGLACWVAFALTARAFDAVLSPFAGVMVALLGAAIAAIWLRARRRPMSDVRAALWVEEQCAADFALVTVVEQAPVMPPLWSPIVQQQSERALTVARARVRPLAVQELRGPGGFALGTVAVLLVGALVPRLSVDRAAMATSASSAVGARIAAPIGAWRIRVTPPAYSALSPMDLGDATMVHALSGSRIDVEGAGAVPDSAWTRLLRDSTQDARRAVAVTPTDARWRLQVAAGDGPSELRVSRDRFAKLLLIDGVADSIPRVSLSRPARDSVLRRATGQLNLAATVHDDIGLSRAAFELVISSGEGERFTVKARQVGARVLRGEHDAILSAALDLASLNLGPGDVMHIRAIARDAHPAASREAGTSETRSFRVARPSEYDSVAVEPAPPPEVDKSLLSQRMLLMLTEKLDRRRSAMPAAAYANESRTLARDQSRLREAVGDAVFQRLTGEGGGEHSHSPGDGHDHGVEAVGGKLALSGVNAEGMLEEGDDSPVIAINKPLLEAYNAMWDAGRALEQSDTRSAIPHMRVALAAIERARAAQRLYLRGRPPTVIIDLDKVRMAGKDTGATNVRATREALPPDAAGRETRLLAAAVLARSDASAARDSLAVLRLESVTDAPAFASALAALLDAMRASGTADVTAGFVRARRALGGVQRVAPSAWSRGGPP